METLIEVYNKSEAKEGGYESPPGTRFTITFTENGEPIQVTETEFNRIIDFLSGRQ